MVNKTVWEWRNLKSLWNSLIFLDEEHNRLFAGIIRLCRGYNHRSVHRWRDRCCKRDPWEDDQEICGQVEVLDAWISPREVCLALVPVCKQGFKSQSLSSFTICVLKSLYSSSLSWSTSLSSLSSLWIVWRRKKLKEFCYKEAYNVLHAICT